MEYGATDANGQATNEERGAYATISAGLCFKLECFIGGEYPEEEPMMKLFAVGELLAARREGRRARSLDEMEYSTATLRPSVKPVAPRP